MNLNWLDGANLISKAAEKRNEDILLQRWIAHYQHEMKFTEFKKKLQQPPETTDTRTKEEILADVKSIVKFKKKTN